VVVAGWIAAVGMAGEPAPNTLTEAERQNGWRLLFDGQSNRGWRSFGKPESPRTGWVVEDGWLKLRGQGGDIVTEGEYDEFELTFEWQVGPGANSGVKYFVVGSRPSALGHEYQLLDDGAKPARTNDLHRTATFYDVLPLQVPAGPRPAGQVNQSRIVVTGEQVEHWLNGVRVLSYQLNSPEVKAAVARSKFKNVAGFGSRLRGHLLLQDHGGEVAFRNLKLRAKSSRHLRFGRASSPAGEGPRLRASGAQHRRPKMGEAAGSGAFPSPRGGA
jgi:hypothetical protein